MVEIITNIQCTNPNQRIAPLHQLVAIGRTMIPLEAIGRSYSMQTLRYKVVAMSPDSQVPAGIKQASYPVSKFKERNDERKKPQEGIGYNMLTL